MLLPTPPVEGAAASEEPEPDDPPPHPSHHRGPLCHPGHHLPPHPHNHYHPHHPRHPLIIHLTIADLCVILVTKISYAPPLLHKTKTRFNLLFLAIQLFGSPPTIVAAEANFKDLSL